MELKQLEYFYAVCQELHFTRAAEKVGISQPSLSQQIKLLEHEIGTPLFDRIGKKTALTESGKLLLQYTRKIFYEVEQAKTSIDELNGLQRGTILVGTLLTVEDYLITPTLLSFHQKYPGVKISVFGLRTGDIHKQLIENKLDLGIVFLPMKGDELESISLSTEEMAFAVPEGHPLENQDMLDVEVLKTTPSILLPQQYFIRNLIDEACKDLGFLPKPIFEITTMQSLINMVLKGVGVTILPKPYLEYLNHPHIRIIPILKPNLSREIGVVYRKDKYLSAATHAFISALKETVCKSNNE
ncbi:LysR family transcriptional regulator [Bacillus stercoris]|uniref:LysR family transcriptional regulator n=1 Tax=Bacillus TaxID=1386 RepID=UPI001FB56558|nr:MULTISPECIES: LysR family transcriptional regulator [Bacillus]MDN0192663.1 LysR family transcriptional regulator [Bacillus sp. B.PNR1]MDN3034913.1 LysR family transcriptional regulator [Bacillus sp. B.PNR2]MEC2113063.1 LysR family transcriptional regulator [Bacillus stercoris]MEC3616565.1 LysR family transcriptional regulator [Bacillus stercoris]WGV96005.1 LysR family transcriptional regulator [Bacillus stercoris]